MKIAAEAHDRKTLSAYIDYPALRDDAYLHLPSHVVTALADIAGRLSDMERKQGSVEAIAKSVLDDIAGGESLDLSRLRDGHVVRDSFDQFRLVARDGKGIQLVFRRHGLGWKLSGVRTAPLLIVD